MTKEHGDMQNRMIRVRMLRQVIFTVGMVGLLAGSFLSAQTASSPQLIASAEAPPPETTTTAPSSPTADGAQKPSLTVLDELTAMKRRIEKLEAELKAAKGETGAAPALTPS